MKGQGSSVPWCFIPWLERNVGQSDASFEMSVWLDEGMLGNCRHSFKACVEMCCQRRLA